MTTQRGPIACFGTPKPPLSYPFRPRAEVVILKDEAGSEWAFREVEENRWERLAIVRPKARAAELYTENEK